MGTETAPPQPPAAPRNRSLDAFRALFIGAVMLYHYLVRWAPPANPADLYGYAHVYSPYLELGRFGVHAFFLISGLFIATTLVRSGDALTFAYKRMYRIYPAFLVAATFTFIVLKLVPPPPGFAVSAKDYLLTLTMVPDNLGATYVDGAYWSLAVEAKFYFWVAIAFAVLRDRFWIGLIGLAIVAALVELALPKVGKEILLAPYHSFFLAGIGLAFHAFLGRRREATILYAAAALNYAWHWNFVAMHDGQVLLPNLALLAMLGAVFLVTLRGWRIDFGPLPYLGLISYEVYLLHQKIGVMTIGALRRTLGLPDLLAASLAALLAVALAALLHHVAQKPVQALFRLGWARLEHVFRRGHEAPPPAGATR